jgi:transposase-like protein
MLAKWTLRDCVHLERRWTLPGKLQSFPKAESPRSQPSGSGAVLRRSGGSSKRRWSKARRWHGVARAHGVNANQVFGWRRLYLAGRLGDPKPGMKLLPVRVSESVPAPLLMERSSVDGGKRQPSTIHIELRQAQRHRLAARLHWAECVGGDETGGEAIFRARVRVSRATWRSDQSSLV